MSCTNDVTFVMSSDFGSSPKTLKPVLKNKINIQIRPFHPFIDGRQRDKSFSLSSVCGFERVEARLINCHFVSTKRRLKFIFLLSIFGSEFGVLCFKCPFLIDVKKLHDAERCT